jgi:eukaryotic-like serine/threonine-protein kinase
MSTPRDRLEALFNHAADLSADRRAEFLDLECKDDPALRAELDTLLAELHTDIATTIQAAAELAVTHQPTPTAIGEFRVIRLLGEGGMGRVYEAEQDSPRRRVALKVVRAGLLARSAMKRFAHETNVLGQLRHPGIAQIYQAGIAPVYTSDDPDARSLIEPSRLPYFAMELVRGPTLTEYARAASLNIEDRLELLARVADAVHHAHQRGVIHLDLKPGNILIDLGEQDRPGVHRPVAARIDPSAELPTPKVLDFGIARLTDAGSTLDSHTQQIVGTLGYMSPEQLAPGDGAIDIRSDVYALGVIAYQLLAGTLPFDVSTLSLPAAAALIRETTPRRLTDANAALDRDVETVIAKAMDRDPDRRYASAAEFAADIRRYLRSEPIAARPATAMYQMRKFARRNRGLVVSAAVALTALLLATVVATVFGFHAERARASADAALRRANLTAALADLQGGNPESALSRLASISPEHRGWEWRYLDRLCDSAIATVTLPDEYLAVALPAAGQHLDHPPDTLLLPQNGGPVFRWRSGSPDGRLETLPISLSGQTAASFITADATTLVTLAGNTLTAHRLADGGTLWSIAGVRSIGPRPQSADTREITFESTAREIARIDAGTGAVRRRYAPPYGADVFPQFATLQLPGDLQPREYILVFALNSTDALDLATGEVRLQVPLTRAVPFADGVRFFGARQIDQAIYDTRTGAVTPAGPRGTFLVSAADPHGEWTAAATNMGSVHVTRLGEGDAGDTGPLQLFADSPRAVNSLTTTPDGRWLLANIGGNMVRWWDMDGLSSIRSVGQCYDFPSGACISASGSRIASLGWGTVRMWDADRGRPLWTRFIGGPPNIARGDFAPSGERLAVAGWDGYIAVLRSDDGDPLWTQRVDRPRAARAVAWAPSGEAIVVGESSGGLTRYDAASGQPLSSVQPGIGAVIALAFTPDANSLVAVGSSGRVIELAYPSLSEIATPAQLRPSDLEIGSAAVSPDGRWLLVSAGRSDWALVDRSSRHAKVLRKELQHKNVIVWSADFSPDSSRLALLCADGLMRVVDPARAHEVIAISIPVDTTLAVRALRDRIVMSGIVSAVVVADAAPTPEAARAWRESRYVRRLTDPLFDALRSSDRVVQALADRHDLPPDVRERSIQWAIARGDPLGALNSDAWEVVRYPGWSGDAVKRAVQDAELCSRKWPTSSAFLNTLGVAYYRADRYEDAVRALLQSETLAASAGNGPIILNTIFLALASDRLGRTEDALQWWTKSLAIDAERGASTDPEILSALAEGRQRFEPARGQGAAE